MTDGAARVIEVVGTEEMKREILPRLCSRNPAKAWTSGQWMTERPGTYLPSCLAVSSLTRPSFSGGSDVSLTETVATPVDPNTPPLPGSAFLLNGFKWFSSATDGDIALALAHTGGPGSKGLSLFLVRLRDEQGKTNGVFVHRLKKKWGTKVRRRETSSSSFPARHSLTAEEETSKTGASDRRTLPCQHRRPPTRSSQRRRSHHLHRPQHHPSSQRHHIRLRPPSRIGTREIVRSGQACRRRLRQAPQGQRDAHERAGAE
jgi:hypothetical protein